MMVDLQFEISTDEYDKTLSLCINMGAEIIKAVRAGSPNGHHDFHVRMACDTFDDYERLATVMLYYLDDPVVQSARHLAKTSH